MAITPRDPKWKIDAATIDALFELAEVALRCAGRAQWATGVLTYLATLPSLRDRARGAKLRTQLLRTIKYDPMEEVAALYEQVKKIADQAVSDIYNK